MGLEDKLKAKAKEAEGKAQEAFGAATGDAKEKAKGQAKQAEAAGMNFVEGAKDKAKDALDSAREAID